MTRRFPSLLRPAGVALALMSLWGSAAQPVRGHGWGGGHYGGWGGHYGGWGGHYGGWGWGGHYGGWGWGPGFYRPYYGLGLGAGAFGLGLGLGYGLGGSGYYAPYYGYGGYGPYYGGGYGPVVYAAGSVSPNALAGNPAGPPPGPAPGNQPPPDNAAHLQLLVPEGAEVWFAGVKIAREGRIREFVSPTLAPGRVYNYQVIVGYTDAAGKRVEDKRDIQVHANDWFSIDFTRPAPTKATIPGPPLS